MPVELESEESGDLIELLQIFIQNGWLRRFGGADADRTRDLYAASVMLSQLSYRPT